jgi:histidine triad (HIT) family protein
MDYVGNDIYCDLIIPGKLPVSIVHETDNVIAFHHTRPNWPRHIVVTPKQHVPSLLDIADASPEILTDIMSVVRLVAGQVKDELGACGVLTNLGDYQDSKHLHIHIYSGKKLTK